MLGHDVTIYDARPKGGGLNEYGIAAYKTPDGFAQAELDWLLGIGGIFVEHGRELGRDLTLDGLRAEHDAVFLGIGLGGVNEIEVRGADAPGVRPAVDFIAELRQATDKSDIAVGRRVVVVGGGMTAIDAAVQSKLLGAEEVTIVYRRGQDRMAASRHEQQHATDAGVRIICHAAPVRFKGRKHLRKARFAYTMDGPDGLRETGETFDLKADQVLMAIGQCSTTSPMVSR